MQISRDNLEKPELQERMVKMVLKETKETKDQLDILGHLVSILHSQIHIGIILLWYLLY